VFPVSALVSVVLPYICCDAFASIHPVAGLRSPRRGLAVSLCLFGSCTSSTSVTVLFVLSASLLASVTRFLLPCLAILLASSLPMKLRVAPVSMAPRTPVLPILRASKRRPLNFFTVAGVVCALGARSDPMGLCRFPSFHIGGSNESCVFHPVRIPSRTVWADCCTPVPCVPLLCTLSIYCSC